MLVIGGVYSVTFPKLKKTVTAEKGEIVFIPFGIEFTHKVVSPFTGYNISFFTTDTEHPFYLAATIGKIVLPREQMDAIIAAMSRISILPHNSKLLEHIAEHILVENYLFCQGEGASFKPFSDEVMMAVAYMRQNLHRKIDIDELAEKVYLSHNGLIWKFKQELDTTPSEYLKLLRLRNAKDLLINESYSITEISEMCGYSSPYYFTNVFHRHYGVTPTEFRRINSKEYRT
ncbi:MAG: helix-turn-helix transcriptional regulator [Clostridia bacterium]|nr:helix-turn-helix transcriptional regulator [Clostridia bacterium]